MLNKSNILMVILIWVLILVALSANTYYQLLKDNSFKDVIVCYPEEQRYESIRVYQENDVEIRSIINVTNPEYFEIQCAGY